MREDEDCHKRFNPTQFQWTIEGQSKVYWTSELVKVKLSQI